MSISEFGVREERRGSKAIPGRGIALVVPLRSVAML